MYSISIALPENYGIYILTIRIRSRSREHAQEDRKGQIHNCRNGNRLAKTSGVEHSWKELILAPDKSCKDGHHPGQIITGDSQGEESIRCGIIDEAEKSKDDSEYDDTPDHADRLVPDAFADMAKEAGEGEGAVAREGPALARCSDYLLLMLILREI